MAVGIDALECAGSDLWAVESQSRPGTVFLVNADATGCACEAGQGGDPVCAHRALVRFVTGTLALPTETCPTCQGEGVEGVGWTLAPDLVTCGTCNGAGQIEQTVAAFLASIPTTAEVRRGTRERATAAA
jgi:hypothetical protein